MPHHGVSPVHTQGANMAPQDGFNTSFLRICGFSFAFSFFRLPFFFEHYLTSLVPFGTPALIEMCFHVNLQVELCSSILVETQLLSQNWFCILVELCGHKFDWLEEGIDGEQNRANASQCNWTFSLTISVEIQFLSAWCSWDAPALWSICIWIIGRSWDATILAWYVKTVHYSEIHLLRR